MFAAGPAFICNLGLLHALHTHASIPWTVAPSGQGALILLLWGHCRWQCWTESTKRPYSSLRPACLVPTPGSRAHAEAVHIPPQFPRIRAFRRVTLPRENDLLALQRESRCAWRSALLMLDAKGVRSGAASPSFPGSYIRAVPPQVPVGLCAQPPKFHKDTPLAGRAWTPGFPVLHPQLWPTPVLSLN